MAKRTIESKQDIAPMEAVRHIGRRRKGKKYRWELSIAGDSSTRCLSILFEDEDSATRGVKLWDDFIKEIEPIGKIIDYY